MSSKTQIIINKEGFDRGVRRLDMETCGEEQSWGSDLFLGNVLENLLREVFGSEVELILPDYWPSID